MGSRVSADPVTPRRARGFVGGVAFLTRLPVRTAVTEADIGASVAWFPVVGALIGAASGIVFWGAASVAPGVVAALLAVATSVALTGAFHEDGLADTADAFGAASTGRDPHSAMKDPRLGAFGVLALVVGVGLRAAALAALAPRAGALALVAAHAAARGASATVVTHAPRVADGLGSSHARLATRRRGIVAATLGAVIASVALGSSFGPATPLVALAGLAATSVVLARWARTRLGGVSGDVLGAIEQTGEVAVLLSAAAAFTQGWTGPLA